MDDSTKKPESESEEAPAESERVEVSDEVRKQRRQRAYRALLEGEQLKIIQVPDDLVM